jgi:hypothetical protein
MAGRFGQMLGRFVPVSEHDIQEVLEEQSLSHRKFGDIALSWGICRPDHVWRAWCAQLAYEPQRIDLHDIGIDTQALAFVDRATAVEYTVLPVRALDDELIVATSDASRDRAVHALPQLLKHIARFVVADESSLLAAIEAHYAT